MLSAGIARPGGLQPWEQPQLSRPQIAARRAGSGWDAIFQRK